jgi:hypothetical protein
LISLPLEIHDDPLRMQSVILASKRRGEVGIALPIAAQIAIVQARITAKFSTSISCETAAA